MFHRVPKKKKRKVIVWAGIFTASVFMFVVFQGFPPSFVKRGIMFTLQPLFYFKSKTNDLTDHVFLAFREKETLAGENIFLKQRIMELELKENFFGELIKENKELKSALSIYEEKKVVLAPILLRPGYGIYNTLIIGAGLNKGIKKGLPVAAFENILLGHVYEVSSNTSKIRMISYPGEETNVFIESRLAAVAVGTGGENMEISLPRDVEIEIGERVTTIDGNFFFVGIVEKIVKNPTDSFQKIIFRTPLNIQELRYVYLIMDY